MFSNSEKVWQLISREKELKEEAILLVMFVFYTYVKTIIWKRYKAAKFNIVTSFIYNFFDIHFFLAVSLNFCIELYYIALQLILILAHVSLHFQF